MTLEQVIGLTLALLLMGVGMIGSVIPLIPGTSLIFVTAVAHRLYFGAAGASLTVLATLGGLMLLSLVLDYLASMYGAKKLGASKLGMVGAALGALVGVFFSLPGILLGPFIGAFLFEMAAQRPCKAAAVAGIGATCGLFAGALGKLLCCFLMIGLFTANVVYRSSHTLEAQAIAQTKIR